MVGKIEMAEGSHLSVNKDSTVYHGGAPAAERAEPVELRVAMLGASPYDVTLGAIRADREFRAIRDAAGKKALRVGAHFAATAADLNVVLNRPRPDVLHLCCHGNSRMMMFETLEGDPHRVSVDSVVERMTSYHDDAGLRLRCLVLSMCHSAEIAPRFAPLVETVIAWRGEIDDRCAIAFAGEFYRIAAGRHAPTLGAAARTAAMEVRARDDLPCRDVTQRLVVIGP